MSPQVALIMGSQSDWPTMQDAARTLQSLEIHFEARILSAHRTPDLHGQYVDQAIARGIEVIIAAAGGAAHLAGVTAARTRLPVLGVPMETKALNGLDSLLSIVQMPAGIPVGTLAIGRAGAINAALFAAAILALKNPGIAQRLDQYRTAQSDAIAAQPSPKLDA